MGGTAETHTRSHASGTRAEYGPAVLRQDFIKRLVEKMAAFIAKIAGLAADGRFDEADQELAELERELALPRGYEALDSRSLALLIGHADKVALACLVFWYRAEIAIERGQVADAARHQLRARGLFEAISRGDLSRPALELLSNHPMSQRS